MTTFNRVIGDTHHKLVFGRRMKAIAAALTPHIPAGDALDLGCGNGMIAHLIEQGRGDVRFVGVDVVMRPETLIPVAHYDGANLPFADDSFHAVTVVDVLHHTPDFRDVLREALRVSERVIIKDHFYRNRLEHLVLRGMDWYGNIAHGVALPYNYFTRAGWESGLRELHAREIHRQEAVDGLYPPVAQQLIGRRIQFVSCIVRAGG